MSNVETAIDAIRNMNKDELVHVIDAVKLRHTSLARQTTRSLQLGDTVEFTNKQGRTVSGTVTKINRKTLIVKNGFTTWRVPAAMCSQNTVA